MQIHPSRSANLFGYHPSCEVLQSRALFCWRTLFANFSMTAAAVHDSEMAQLQHLSDVDYFLLLPLCTYFKCAPKARIQQNEYNKELDIWGAAW